MVNIQLYVEGQLCDFDNKTMMSLQKEFINEAELIVKEVEYSYSISIPVSETNMKIFGFKNTFDVANKFNKIYNASMYANEMCIINGKFKLNEITNKFFKGNIYVPSTVGISDILGDRKLNEIQPHMKLMNNLSDFTQTNNYVMGMNTTDIPPAKYRDRHVCYPYILYSLPYNTVDNSIEHGLDFYTQDLKYGNHTFTNENVFPAFNVCSVIKDMFETEGYNVTGNIFGDEKFKDLYQTFKYPYADYVNNRDASYYLNFSFNYTNIKFHSAGYSISPTLTRETMWQENGHDVGNDAWVDGRYICGVDNPLMAGKNHTIMNIISNDQHILKNGADKDDAYVIVAPRDGWYRIRFTGKVRYPIENADVSNVWGMQPTGVYFQDNGTAVGAVYDEAERTDFETKPFEFQIKKGSPKDNPRLYSFNGGAPNMPRAYVQGTTVFNLWTGWENADIGIQVPTNITSERLTWFPKNEKQIIIRNYTEFDERNHSDLICGVRFGGSVCSRVYQRQYYGEVPDPDRHAYRAELLALPLATQPLNLLGTDKGMAYRMADHVDWDTDQATGWRYEYAAQTAQVMLPQDNAYYNFDGYNQVDYSTGNWDTTSNIGAFSYPFADSSHDKKDCYATTSGGDYGRYGTWVINEVVWLDKGDTLNFEACIPRHRGGHYTCCHSEWLFQHDWVNAVTIDGNFEMAYIMNDRKWTPSNDEPIPDFVSISSGRETNVNKFLPDMSCNDYLNKFLQTFNLQLTHPTNNTFSIDYAKLNEIEGNIVSIEELANIDQAEFKTIESPSTRELSWKIDKNETGYADGNKSPYKTENLPWYESGYTGGIKITNETNTSGQIDKKESAWSYNWYKNIKFINGLGLTVSGAPISVISDKSTWSTETSYGRQEGESPQSNKTMRLFFLSKNVNTSMYDYIEFKYDELEGVNKNCRLVIPSNSIMTKQASGNREYLLDYNNTLKNKKKYITDIFFNLAVQGGYQIDVPVKLDNNTYSKIKAGTLIKFNDGLYKAKMIEGHDVSENDFATMSLLTLK